MRQLELAPILLEPEQKQVPILVGWIKNLAYSLFQHPEHIIGFLIFIKKIKAKTMGIRKIAIRMPPPLYHPPSVQHLPLINKWHSSMACWVCHYGAGPREARDLDECFLRFN